MAKSPSITILERDMSAYTVTSSDTVLAIVGYATKGPIGKPTLVSSRADFNEKFGVAVKGSPWSALAAYRAFNQGNKIIFDRVATETGAAAATAAEAVAHNELPATSGTGGIDLGAASLTVVDGDSYAVGITIDDASTPVQANFTANGTTVSSSEILTAIQTAIGTTATAELTNSDTVIVITSASTGSTSKVDLSAGDTVAYDHDLLSETGVSEVTPVDGVPASGTSTDNVAMRAREKGSSTNLISVTKSSRENPVTSETVHKIEVFYDGVLKETFDDVSLSTESDNYFVKVINETFDNGGSRFITFEVNDIDTNNEILFNDGSWTLGTGTDEKTGSETISDYDYVVGTDGFDSDPAASADNITLFTEQLRTSGDLGNTELFDYHILITPDMPEEEVQNSAIALAEFRQDFIYVADPPFGLNHEQVIQWHNGSGGLRDTALGSSYSSLYWSWLKDYNSDAKEYVWCPPSVFIAEKYMEIDRKYGPWFAPAGDLRGKINASDYEASPSFAQREALYGDFNAVNPIVNFVSKGLEVYGQKTLIRENTSLNRVNVRRMIIFAKKLIKKALEAVLFEPHNPDSWRKASNLVTAILEPIRQAGGIDQYAVIIDETVNTPDVIAQNIMKGTVKIIPTNTIEIIEITMQVNKAGASLAE